MLSEGDEGKYSYSIWMYLVLYGIVHDAWLITFDHLKLVHTCISRKA